MKILIITTSKMTTCKMTTSKMTILIPKKLVFDSGMPIQPGLMFGVRLRAYPRVKLLTTAPFGLANYIRQGWKGRPGTKHCS